MRRVISLDQSSRVTGYAVFDNKQLIASGHFSIPANKTMGQRLMSFINKMDEVIEKYHPEKIYYEGIQYQNNIETYKKLAMIQAMVIYNSELIKDPIAELTPSH
jgi:Holliday junction resolvasome RuvABC endonuclease subunit